MADLRISDLVTASLLKDDDYYEIAQSESGTRVSYKTTLLAIAVQIATMVDFTSDLNTTSKKITGAINELKQLISLIPQFSIEVVEELPTEDISDTTIYLVPAEDPEVGNYYEEYIHVNDAWELVGTTAVDLSAYYTKLEVDGLLATKASVAEVALKENKTDMPTDVRTIIKDCKTPKSATITNGIAQFECIEENLVKGLKVTMNPIQDLSHGDPSPTNICPISGRTEASMVRTGKNILYKTIEGVTIGTNGAISANSSYNIVIAQVLQGKTYTFSLNGVASVAVRSFFTAEPASGSSSYNGERYTTDNTFVSPITGYVAIRTSTNATNIQLENGSTATEYTPYVETETHTHQYSETVYGGSDDFVNGGATVSTGFIEFDGSNDESWTIRANGGFLITIPDAGQVWTTTLDKGKSNMLIADNVKAYDNSDNAFAIDGSNRCYVSIPSISSVADLRTFLATNNLQIAYPLSTPTTIQTSAEEITTVSGTNIISGTEPISECKYTELATVDDLRKIIGGQ